MTEKTKWEYLRAAKDTNGNWDLSDNPRNLSAGQVGVGSLGLMYLGAEGWELVTVAGLGGGEAEIYLFKRPKYA